MVGGRASGIMRSVRRAMRRLANSKDRRDDHRHQHFGQCPAADYRRVRWPPQGPCLMTIGNDGPPTDSPRPEQETIPNIAVNVRPPVVPWRTVSIAGGATGAIVLVLLLLGGILYTRSYEARVYRGVRVAGVPVGGLSRADAQARLAERTTAWGAAPLGVGAGSEARRGRSRRMISACSSMMGRRQTRRWSTGAAAIRWRMPPTGLARCCRAVGRTSPFRTTLDDGRLDSTLRAWAPEATYFPTDATFSVANGGGLTIVADKNGLLAPSWRAVARRSSTAPCASRLDQLHSRKYRSRLTSPPRCCKGSSRARRPS